MEAKLPEHTIHTTQLSFPMPSVRVPCWLVYPVQRSWGGLTFALGGGGGGALEPLGWTPPPQKQGSCDGAYGMSLKSISL